MNLKAIVVSIFGLLLVPAFAPVAEADHCGPVFVFGRVAQAPVTGTSVGVNAGGLGCVAVGEGSPEVRKITPGSPNLQVRYLGSAGGGFVTGWISGLGVDQSITLAYVAGAWDSNLVPIDPLATCSVTATVHTWDGDVTATFEKDA